MPVLTNPKHESFCVFYLEKGRNIRQASISTGYSYHHALSLTKKPHILARIAEIDRGAAIAREAREARVIEEMCCLAFTNLTDVVEMNKDGAVVIKDLESLSEAAKRSLRKITAHSVTTTLGDVKKTTRTLTVELHDKPKALDQLAKVLDMYKPGNLPGQGAGVFRGLKLITGAQTPNK